MVKVDPDLVFIVAGEASADLHAASLIDSLRERRPNLNFFGVGGSRLRERGVDVLLPAESLSIIGVLGWWKEVRRLLRGLRDLKRAVRERRPVAAILLDLPDFNLILARYLKKRGVPVIYYISPQVWAWRKYRIRTIRRVVTRMLVLFPFEKEFYRTHGVRAEFVGHPLLDHLAPRGESRAGQAIRENPRLALLPGSRVSEIEMHGDLLRKVALRLEELYPAIEIRIPVAATLTSERVAGEFQGTSAILAREGTETVLKWADVALVASGTATLETALVGTPFALFYRMSPGNAFIFSRIVRYRGFLGMPNILLGKESVREFFQQGATVNNLVAEAVRLISDDAYRVTLESELARCRNILNAEDTSRLAADQVLEVLRNASSSPVREGLRPASSPA